MEVKFHDIGEGMTEGEILNYLVEVGEEVSVDQPLVEMQTDKMVAEIPSPVAGKVTAIHCNTGETITVGTTIIEIGGKGKKSAQKNNQIVTKETGTNESAQNETFQPAQRINNVKAAPYTRKIAREHDVNIEDIIGTGPNGRVMEEDVYAFVNKQQEEPEKVVKVRGESPVQARETETSPDIIPFKGIRKQIANNLSYSVQTIPHVTHYEEVDVTNVLAFRNDLKEMGEHISIVAFFLKALQIALQDYPIFNAELDEDAEVIRQYKVANIGLATDTKDGLLVPVLTDVNSKSIRDIHVEMKKLTKKAQAGKLTLAEMQHGTFTISNVGPLGGIGATPIINHPQTGIMAFHKTKKIPVVMEGDKIDIRSMMNISLSFDHRVADGAESVRFTNRFVELIEEPKKLLMELV